MTKPSKNTSPAQEVRENSIGWMLKILCSSLDAKMVDELRRLDITLGQFAVLMTLSETEGLTQTEIGKKITMPGYATTRTIDALAEKQLVVRETDDRSRRSYRIYLTKQSNKVVPKLFATVMKVNEELLSPLSSIEKKQLAVVLKKLVFARLA